MLFLQPEPIYAKLLSPRRQPSVLLTPPSTSAGADPSADTGAFVPLVPAPREKLIPPPRASSLRQNRSSSERLPTAQDTDAELQGLSYFFPNIERDRAFRELNSRSVGTFLLRTNHEGKIRISFRKYTNRNGHNIKHVPVQDYGPGSRLRYGLQDGTRARYISELMVMCMRVIK